MTRWLRPATQIRDIDCIEFAFSDDQERVMIRNPLRKRDTVSIDLGAWTHFIDEVSDKRGAVHFVPVPK